MSDRTVMIVEDHELMAQGLSLSLRAEGFTVEVVRPPTADAVLETAARLRPALVLLDLDLGEGTTGLPLIAPLREGGARVVMLTGVTDPVRLAECVEAGAVGLAGKTDSFDTVLDKVLRVLGGESVLSSAERDTLLDELRRVRVDRRERLEPFERLTRREREVLAALMEGRSASWIAEASFVSVATIRSQINSVLQKLGVSSQLAATALARKAGWTPDESEQLSSR